MGLRFYLNATSSGSGADALTRLFSMVSLFNRKYEKSRGCGWFDMAFRNIIRKGR